MLRVNSKTRELFVYDVLGPSEFGFVAASDFVEKLEELGPGPLNVRLNTPGGTVDEAIAVISQLKRHDGPVSVTVDSLAASAGSVFLDKAFAVSASPAARIMIHKSWTIAAGNADDFRKHAEQLDAYDATLAITYARMNATSDEVMAMMAAETWFTATQALEIGLIDSIDDNAKADGPEANVKLPKGVYKNTPPDLLSSAEELLTPRRTAAKLRMMQNEINRMRQRAK